MTNHPVPAVMKKKSRSEGAKRMWERRKNEKRNHNMTEKKFDWHLFLGAMSIIISLGGIIFGCYFSLKSDIGSISKEIAKIETVLILKGVAPADLFSSKEE
jgi:hypothetical protein